ncbi:hypothetical protein FNH09_02075 [Streptomyces adustus]|uniref:Uncharacterized protein n=1 Tax=Streptomyces adustus TaxID=1609272 RepID=A0A5N8V842_9ACTN|nr:hypothetical protein [Streptomyces adustus]
MPRRPGRGVRAGGFHAHDLAAAAVAARLTRGGRRLHLRISATWPWRHELTTAFHRLSALPPSQLTYRSLSAHDPKDLDEPGHSAGTSTCQQLKPTRPLPSWLRTTPRQPQPKWRG